MNKAFLIILLISGSLQTLTARNKSTILIIDSKYDILVSAEKFKTKILLEGQIKEGQITLKESPDYESDFKSGFIGNLNGDTFSGVWTNKDKNKTLNFKTTVNSDNLTIAKSATLIEGTYENIMSSDKFFSSVDLKYITDDLY
jgi:hypothetical protein